MLSAQNAAPSYLLTVPPVTVAANQRAFDLFNGASSGLLLKMLGLWPVPASDVAVTGLVSARFDVLRTSAVGAAGTAATYKGTATTAPTVNPLDTANPALPAAVTARSVPTGGATPAGWLFPAYVFHRGDRARRAPRADGEPDARAKRVAGHDAPAGRGAAGPAGGCRVGRAGRLPVAVQHHP
jgi:hypothetical protein